MSCRIEANPQPCVSDDAIILFYSTNNKTMKAKEKSTRGKEPILVQEEAEPVDRSEKMGYFLRRVEDRVVGMIDS